MMIDPYVIVIGKGNLARKDVISKLVVPIMLSCGIKDKVNPDEVMAACVIAVSDDRPTDPKQAQVIEP